jgi:hypothetical protein
MKNISSKLHRTALVESNGRLVLTYVTNAAYRGMRFLRR